MTRFRSPDRQPGRTTTDPDKARRILDDRPPFFRTWTGVYAAVLGFFGLLVLFFHLLTRILS